MCSSAVKETASTQRISWLSSPGTLGSYNRCLVQIAGLEALQSVIFVGPDYNTRAKILLVLKHHRGKVCFTNFVSHFCLYFWDSLNFLQEACGPAILPEIFFFENGDWYQSLPMLPLHILVFINLSNQLLMCGLMWSFIHISDIFQRKWHFMSDFVQPSPHF